MVTRPWPCDWAYCRALAPPSAAEHPQLPVRPRKVPGPGCDELEEEAVAAQGEDKGRLPTWLHWVSPDTEHTHLHLIAVEGDAGPCLLFAAGSGGLSLRRGEAGAGEHQQGHTGPATLAPPPPLSS